MTHEVATDHPRSRKPRQWGIVSGTFWALLSFFLPQFALVPFSEVIASIPADPNLKLFILQGIAELGSILILWLVLKHVYHVSLRTIGLDRPNLGKMSWAVLAFPVYLIASIIVTNLIGALFSADLTETQNIGYVDPNGFVVALVFIALVCLAPFAEEMLFRGFLFRAFRRVFGFWGGAVIVSLLFAVAHGQLNVGIDVFVLSMFLCYLRERTGSLWPAIALHALKNLVAFVILFIIGVT